MVTSLDTARIRAITIDLDDTLWPVWPTIARAEAALAHQQANIEELRIVAPMSGQYTGGMVELGENGPLDAMYS